MNKSILNNEIQVFINNNLNSDISTLAFKGTSFQNVDTKELIEQIESKKKSEKKLPTWFQSENVYYPNKLNIEQTSSEVTAQYKASIIDGKSIIDITGGFGIDSFYFSKKFDAVYHCEINEELSEIVKHNYQELGITNVFTHAVDGIEYLKKSDDFYDWIYIDPSRRHENKGKVFFLNDCLPDVPSELDSLFEFSNNILIKTSPLLDISAGIIELKFVKYVHVVAVDNEVKELLWILEKEFIGNITVHTANIKTSETQQFQFNFEDELQLAINYHEPLSYLYEPNASILKAGGFKSLASQLGIHKLHKHSHLYTSNEFMSFPGRSFIIVTLIPYNKKEIKSMAIKKANITTRNFPESVQKIRNTTKIKDGGDTYLFFTTNLKNEKIVIVCTKVE
ncbi:class I SAM-dependent methyltransferase [Subsaxibacter sp. CAU 1640]|uniref:class I SAM-dependent methyltransferase n=1 Tax=Subsaxibacter sp. CAU 1640 TaxID=2933271 RepID=UPI002005B71B|nr:class I SAM-dependent methyltransferase [Subsaxibacter sp. CAU 1640]MCK7590894.1 class I SAM-dependent methyltransferase [Subsaxibacter sp. CAU 1640]